MIKIVNSTIFLFAILNNILLPQNSLYTVGGEFYGDAQIRKYDFDSTYVVSWASDLGNFSEIVIGDANNDMENDLIIAEDREKNVVIYSIEQAGTISKEIIEISPWYEISNMIIADVDKDGKNEIIIQQFFNNLLIYSYENTGYKLDYSVFIHFAESVNIGDVDNDNEIEIIVGLRDSIKIFTYSDLEQSYEIEYTILSSGLNDCPVIADVDNDGSAEVVSGGYYNAVRVWEYVDSSFVYINEYPVGGASQGVAVGDVNGDEKNEIIVGTDGREQKNICNRL